MFLYASHAGTNGYFTVNSIEIVLISDKEGSATAELHLFLPSSLLRVINIYVPIMTDLSSVS